MTNWIAASEIQISQDRIRRNFDQTQMDLLIQSILQRGLLHAPVLRRTTPASDGQDATAFLLVSGERRLRAMKALHENGDSFTYIGEPVPPGMIPYVAFEDLSSREALEVELEENIIRQDISWQERAQAVARLHKMKVEDDPSWTKKDTIDLINPTNKNVSHTVTQSLALAQHLDNPKVASAKTEREAYKILRRELENSFRAKLAELGPEESSHTLLQGDCLTIMQTLPDETFDVILTDPPYGIDAQNFDAEMVTTHDYTDDWTTVRQVLRAFASESWRLAKPQAHLYVFCAYERSFELAEILRMARWDVWKRPFIWVKDMGHTPKIDYGPSYHYECILFANKGKRLVTAKASDICVFPTVKDKPHAAQKPVELYANLLARSVLRGVDKVLDPFCGSGTIFPAANRLGLTATGIELDPATIGIAMERLNSKE